MSLVNSNNPPGAASNILMINSSDPAWEWGECRDPNKRQNVWCKLCNKVVSGGISRLKAHLLSIRGNCTSCPSATIEIKKKIQASIDENRKKKATKARIRSILEEQDDNEDIVEEQETFHANNENVGTNKRNKHTNVRGPLDLVMEQTKQSSLDKTNPHKQALKKIAWKKFAKWGYEVGLPFNAVRTSSFDDMIHAIGDYGRGMSAPSYHHYRVTLLKEVLDETTEFVESFRKHWEIYGCSIMSDFWTDTKNRCLINFLVNCPKGTIFLKSIDATNHVKDANLIVEMINDVISFVGEENIVSFQTDNGSNYKLAGEILEQQHPNLFWLPCAAHCINLMLKDIGEQMEKIKSTLAKAKIVVGFIYNRVRVLGWFRKLSNGRDLHKSCVTRFASSFYTVQSMMENRVHVQVLFVSERWRKSSFSSIEDGKRVERIVGRKLFWDNALYTCRIMSPIVDVLRLVDREEKPCMGYIYEAMSRAKDIIEKNLGNDHRTCTRVWNIIDNRWSDQLHRPLHAAGYYLNPGVYYKQAQTQIETNSVIKAGLFKSMERLISESEVDMAMDQLRNYRDATGTFGMKSAISRRDKMQPYEWWMQYGSDTPSLTKFAIRVLSQTCSASPCERNWSVFDNLHSKKRNCLHQEKLNHLVYIQYNQKLERRFKERLADGSSDPILLKEIDECDEWIIPSEEELLDSIMEGDDLTLEQAHVIRSGDENEGPNTRSRVRRTLFANDHSEEDREVELELGELDGQDLGEDDENELIDIDI